MYYDNYYQLFIIIFRWFSLWRINILFHHTTTIILYNFNYCYKIIETGKHFGDVFQKKMCKKSHLVEKGTVKSTLLLSERKYKERITMYKLISNTWEYSIHITAAPLKFATKSEVYTY